MLDGLASPTQDSGLALISNNRQRFSLTRIIAQGADGMFSPPSWPTGSDSHRHRIRLRAGAGPDAGLSPCRRTIPYGSLSLRPLRGGPRRKAKRHDASHFTLANGTGARSGTGGAILMVAILLQKEGLLWMKKLGGELGIYGVISAETSREEGLILAAWSGMLSGMAGDLPKFHTHRSPAGP